jgi:hypothetical protein
MAVVARPPLYVPRPAAEPYWQGTPLASEVITLLTAAQIFGVGGQAPTKQWHYDYVADPIWQGAPTSNVVPQLLGGGQVPTKQWRYDYVPDPIWTGALIPSAIDQLVSLEVGPVRPKQWEYHYVADPDWVANAVWGLQAPPDILFNPPGGKPFSKQNWRYDYVPAVDWVWEAPPALTAILPVTVKFYGAIGQAPTTFWVNYYNYVPDAFWTWTAPQTSILLAQPSAFTFYGAPGQVPTKDWKPYYNYSQPETFWSWTGIVGPPDILFHPSGGQPPTTDWQPYYNYDVAPPIWNWRGPPDRTILQPAAVTFYGQPGQAPNHLPQYEAVQVYYDQTPQLWQGSPAAGFTVARPGPPTGGPLQITDTIKRIQLPINAVLGDGTPELDRRLPDNILRKIFRE